MKNALSAKTLPSMALVVRHVRHDLLYFCAVNRRLFKKENFLKYFAFSYGLYFIGIFSLLLSDVYYMDDQRRAMTGITRYSGDVAVSRVIAEYVSRLLGMQDYKTHLIADISPLLQLVAIAILAFGSIVLVKLVSGKLSYSGMVAALPLGLSPYFLECLAFKFDAPLMALSVIVTIVPFLYLRRTLLFSFLSLAAVLVMLTTYQAANGIYPLIVYFAVVCSWGRVGGFCLPVRKVARFMAYSAAAYILAMAFFELFIHNYNAAYHYKSGVLVETNVPAFINALRRNILLYVAYVANDFHGTVFLKLCWLVAGAFLLSYMRRSKGSYMMALSLGFVSFGFFLSYGCYFFLKEPFFVPRAFSGFGCFFAILSIFVIDGAGIAGKVLIYVFGYNLVLIASMYGNTLAAQHEYSNFRRDMMISDLLRVLPVDANEKIDLRVHPHKIKLHPVVENSARYMPLMERMNFEFLDQWWTLNWPFHSVRFHNFVMFSEGKPCGRPDSVMMTFESRLNLIRQYPGNCYELYFK